MPLSWLDAMPGPLLGVVVIGLFVAVSAAGYVATRGLIHRRPQPANDLVGHVYAGIGVIYAVLLAMIAVGTWETFTETRHQADREASACLQLYRALGSYPSPFREARRAEIERYVARVIDTEWPRLAQARPVEVTDREVSQLVRGWASYQPASPGAALFHLATLDELDALLEARRMRLLLGRSGIPGVLWSVILLGAFITIGFTYFFWTENAPLHLLTIVALGAMTGLMVFLILMLDRPLHGPLTLRPESFTAVQEVIRGLGGAP